MFRINALLVEDNPIDFSLRNLLKEENIAYVQFKYKDVTSLLIKEIRPNIIIFNLNTLSEPTLIA